VIHPRTKSNPAGYVPLGLQTFENADNCSPREPVLAGKISGGQQPGARPKPAFKNGTAQFFV
jgi:hypothetical protein